MVWCCCSVYPSEGEEDRRKNKKNTGSQSHVNNQAGLLNPQQGVHRGGGFVRGGGSMGESALYAHVDSALRSLAGQAEGFGRFSIGGMHGSLYCVTSLDGKIYIYVQFCILC